MRAPRPIELRSQRDINLRRIPLQLSLAAVGLFAITLIPDILDKYGVIHIPSWLTMGSIDDARAIRSAIMGAVATVLALMFSVAPLVLSMVSTLFGPRLLYRFLQDWRRRVPILSGPKPSTRSCGEGFGGALRSDHGVSTPATASVPTYPDAMNKFTKAAATVNLRPVVRPERLWETRGSRLPLRGVIRLWIGIGSLWNLDGPRRRSPTGRGPRAVSAEVPLIRKKRGYYAQGVDLCFHPRQLDFFQPENFVSIFHKSTPLESLRSIRSLCALKLDSGKNSNPKEWAVGPRQEWWIP